MVWIKFASKSFVCVLCVLFCFPVAAIEPAEFEKTPLSSQCREMIQDYAQFLRLKKQGLGREQAHSIALQQKVSSRIPVDAINNAYDHPDLDNSHLATYTHISCKAKELNYPILPFASAVELMKECQRKTTMVSECDDHLRNRLMGLPMDYQRNTNSLRPDVNMMTKAPPPVLSPPMKLFRLESVGCKMPYPDEARSKDQTGVTTIEVVLNSDGSLKEHRVAKSSGFRLLDNAAKNGIGSCDLSGLLSQGATPENRFHVSYQWEL